MTLCTDAGAGRFAVLPERFARTRRQPQLTSVPFALRLLGGVSLLHPDGTPASGRATHRHPLALLARLALAPAEGLSRDKLAGLLWSERDDAAARHRLRGALHELRQLLGPDVLPATGTTVRLDANHLNVDVLDLLTAHAAGDAAKVVTLYRGPFLDGFFLEDAEEFEEWSRAERGRLAGIQAAALERLALQAKAAGDPQEALRWWTALSAERPADGRIARAAFDARVAAGDPGGALAHAVSHQRHLREEFGVAPDAEFRAAVAALRREIGAAAPDDEPPLAAAPVVPPPSVAGAKSEQGASAEAIASLNDKPSLQPLPSDFAPRLLTNSAPDAPTAAKGSPAPAVGRNWRRTAALAALFVSAAAAVAVFWPRRSVVPTPSRDAPTSLAVAPFRVVEGVSGTLGDGLALLLTATLDQVPELRLLPATAAASLPDGDTGAPTGSRGAPRRVAGAELLVEGVIAPAGPGLISVTAALTDNDGVVRTRIREHGAVADLAGVVDRVALALLRELWGRRWGVPAPRAGSVLTDSASALRAYLRGEAFLRAAVWDSATVAFIAAAEIDSTFALAQLRLAETYGWRNRGENAEIAQALSAAARHADRLAPRERGLLELRRLHGAGELDAMKRADALAARYPNDPEVRYVQADVRFHADGATGRAGRDAIVAAFDTAMALDSTSARVLVHPFTLALWGGDRTRYDHVSARLAALESDPRLAAKRALIAAVRFSPPVEAFRALADGLRRDPRVDAWQELTWAINAATLDADVPRPDLLIDALELMRAAFASNVIVRRQLDGVRLDVLVAAGRLAEAQAQLDAGSVNAFVLMAFGDAPPSWYKTVARQLARETEAGRDTIARMKWLNPYRRALLALSDGNSVVARRELAVAGRGLPVDLRDHVDSSEVRALQGLLSAAGGWARVLEGDSTAALNELEAGLRAVGYVPSALGWAPPLMVIRSRLLAAGSRRAEAINLLPVYQGGGVAWGSAFRLEAAVRRAQGDTVGANVALARAAALWAGADVDVRILAERGSVGTSER